MIYNLRKKFIIISAVSVSVVFAIIFGVIYFVSTRELNRTMDMLTEVISSNDGIFPNFEENQVLPVPSGFRQENLITPDTPFSTRFFTVWADENNSIMHTNVERISSVSEAQAELISTPALQITADNATKKIKL